MNLDLSYKTVGGGKQRFEVVPEAIDSDAPVVLFLLLSLLILFPAG
jgi:hypothetical protein